VLLDCRHPFFILVIMHELVLGIDIGGTNTAFGLVDRAGNIHFEQTTKTRKYIAPQDLVNFIYHSISEQIDQDQLIGIGIGVPNGNFHTGNMEFAPNVHWQGIVPFTQMFSDTFQKKAILTNDANAAAMGEMFFGAAKGMDNFVLLTIGTGVGSGIVENGKVIYGHYGLAGEYGHVRVVSNGRLCACGRKGCLETYASSTGMVRSIQELESLHKQQSALLQMANPTSKDVVESYLAGDMFASEIIQFTVQILGDALADFLCFSNPQAYILFGGYARASLPWATWVKEQMEKSALKIYENQTEIRISTLHDKNAAVLGASTLIFDASPI